MEIIRLGSSGPKLVFVNGWGANLKSYEDGVNKIAETHQVYNVILDGFGEKDQLKTFSNSVREQAKLFTEVFQELALNADEKVHLMGHSTGAGVALLAARNHMNKVKTLTMFNPIGNPESVMEMWQRLTANKEWALIKKIADQKLTRIPKNVKLGIDAKTEDLFDDLYFVSMHISTWLIASREDKVAPIGRLKTAPQVFFEWINYGHSWINKDPLLFNKIVSKVTSR